MAYDQKLAERVRKILSRRKWFSEVRMFGGLCFTLKGNMCCGVEKDRLMVRVGPERYGKALKEPHARPMDFTGRPFKGFLFVGPGGYKSAPSLRKWVAMSADFALSLPPK